MDHHWVQQKQQVNAPLKVQKTMEQEENFGEFVKLSKYKVKNLKHILGTFQRCNATKEGMHI